MKISEKAKKVLKIQHNLTKLWIPSLLMAMNARIHYEIGLYNTSQSNCLSSRSYIVNCIIV